MKNYYQVVLSSWKVVYATIKNINAKGIITSVNKIWFSNEKGSCCRALVNRARELFHCVAFALSRDSIKQPVIWTRRYSFVIAFPYYLICAFPSVYLWKKGDNETANFYFHYLCELTISFRIYFDTRFVKILKE